MNNNELKEIVRYDIQITADSISIIDLVITNNCSTTAEVIDMSEISSHRAVVIKNCSNIEIVVRNKLNDRAQYVQILNDVQLNYRLRDLNEKMIF